MGKVTNVGSLPPDHPRFSTGTQVFTYKRPRQLKDTETIEDNKDENNQSKIDTKPTLLSIDILDIKGE